MKCNVKSKKIIVIIFSIIVILLLILCCIINDIYKSDIVSNNSESTIKETIQNKYYKSIEELPENYTLQEAVNDKCIVRAKSSKIYNSDILDEFLQKVKNNEAYFIRCITFTIEGDMIITDVNFIGNNIFKVCRDSTRDKYSRLEDRTYSYGTFSKIIIEQDEESVKVNLTDDMEGNFHSLYVAGYEKYDEKIN